jgi:hypothetical protein
MRPGGLGAPFLCQGELKLRAYNTEETPATVRGRYKRLSHRVAAAFVVRTMRKRALPCIRRA